MSEAGIFLLFTFYAAGALLSLFSRHKPHLARRAGMGAGVIASLWGILYAFYLLITDPKITIPLPVLFPFASFSLKLDPVSSLFLLLIHLVTFPISLYSLGYLKEYTEKQGFCLGSFGFLYHGFLISLVLVVLANHALLFLIAWEAMAVFSYFLVMYEGRENTKCVSAGFFYITMTHGGTALILVAFLILYLKTGSLDFEFFRTQGPLLPEILKTLVFLCALLGFGAKAGMIPLHGWLPEAHPVAPSNISALMSAVMLKTAIYGMLRFFFDFLGMGPWWWGGILLVTGGATALIGVLYALMEKEIKRLLAYSSIENIGIILLGVGLSLIFHAYQQKMLTLLVLVALLYHALNHAVFKSLLFAGAGAIVYSVHSKNMNELGGLIKVLPVCSGLVLVGALSMAALPPLNGFVSEWLLFQSLLQGTHLPSTLSKVAIPLAGTILALTGALAAVVSLKFFGISFLGMARSAKVAHARPLPRTMKAGMTFLAFLCLGMGLGAVGMVSLLEKVASSLLQTPSSHLMTPYWGGVTISISFSSLSLPAVFVMIFLSVILLYLSQKRGGILKKGPTWDCGIPELKPRMEYVESAYTKPFRIIFKKMLMPAREFEKKYYFPYFPSKMRYTGHITAFSFFDRYLYQPIAKSILKAADKVRLLHSGSINLYLAYIFITLILILMFQNIKG